MKRDTIVDMMYDSIKKGLEYIQSEPAAISMLSKIYANRKKIVFGENVEANTTDDKQ